jgi:hypothetical protein
MLKTSVPETVTVTPALPSATSSVPVGWRVTRMSPSILSTPATSNFASVALKKKPGATLIVGPFPSVGFGLSTFTGNPLSIVLTLNVTFPEIAKPSRPMSASVPLA